LKMMVGRKKMPFSILDAIFSKKFNTKTAFLFIKCSI